MLKQLTIKNYALIDHLEVDFSDGLNIITGETGAGKSILLGGLALVLGKRADLAQIKDRSKKCVVEALLHVKDFKLEELFESNDLDYDNELILRRELLSSGKSRAFINDTPVKLEVLQSISSNLIDVHSQNQTLQLKDDTYIFSIIDGVSGNAQELKSYSLLWQRYKTIIRELENLQKKQSEALKLHDYNSFLLKELNEIKLTPSQLEALEEEQLQLENAELIQQNLQYSIEVLNNDDLGIVDKLKDLKRQLDEISTFGQSFQQLSERILTVIIELEDVSQDLSSEEEQVIHNPEALDEVNQKIQLVNQLLIKHNVSELDELLKIRVQLSKELETTLSLEDRIEAYKKDQLNTELELRKLAKQLSSNRRAEIPTFKEELEDLLALLGMPNAQFKIELEEQNQLTYNGLDALHFKFTANKGAEFRELKDAASGGELSRIMLCLKSILAQHIKLPTLIFDEIDTGVSGEIADKMGDIMKQMSAHFQVMSITHLPQVAAKGQTHFKVYKQDEAEVTITKIKALTKEERVSELAMMLGGVEKFESAVVHAKQLLN